MDSLSRGVLPCWGLRADS